MHANKREEIASAEAGDIAAVVGIKDVITGNTLVLKKVIHYCLNQLISLHPVISTSIEPKNKG